MDSFWDFLATSIGSAVLVSAAAWLARNVIATRLNAAVKHEFDEKIENLRAGLREREQKLSDELRDRATTVATMQSQAFSALAARRSGVEQRRLEAIDSIWAYVTGPLRSLSTAASFLTMINFQEALAHSIRREEVRRLFGTFMPPRDLVDGREAMASKAVNGRPYVSDTMWNLYEAYAAIVNVGILRLRILADGIDTPNLIDEAGVKKTVLAGLPHQERYIEDNGIVVLGHLLGEVEGRLLAEIRHQLDGKNVSDQVLGESIDLIAATYRAQENIAATRMEGADGAIRLAPTSPPP